MRLIKERSMIMVPPEMIVLHGAIKTHLEIIGSN